ncbi:MAG: hypothetical protein WBA00_08380 [Rhodococcus sp. (in: high G+C Gram-positive bacteria)]
MSSRRPAVLAPGGVFDVEAAEASAIAEITSALAVSTSTVTEWMYLTGIARPAVREAFEAGRLVYPVFRTVCRSLAGFSNATEALLRRIVDTAARCTPGAVAAAVDRILVEFDADWHRKVRAEAATERTASVRRLPRGQAELRLRGPQEDIAAMWHSILGTARTVCAGDPRRLGARFFDAARAILTGTPVSCECSADACPHRGTHPTGPTTRAYIVLDAATAAGLAGEPGHLQGWGEIPPDVARRIAADATWQAIITDALTPTRCQCTEQPETETPSTEPPVPIDTREVRRTRARPPGWTPNRGRLDSRKARDLARKLECLRRSPRSLDAAPSDHSGQGGHTTPPDGALTYRPSESLAALVTARYPVCVHPGCAVPSSDCDLDHVIPFDHDDPTTGGWTVLGNLQPLCRRHHGLKTRKQWHYRMLTDGGIVHTRDPHGRDYLTGPGE